MEPGEDHAAGGPEEDQGPPIDLKRYLFAVRKYFWLIAALLVISVAGAVVYTTRVTPIYEATASVQIEPRLPDLLGTGDMFNVAAGNNAAEYYKQQKQVLSSLTLARMTIEQNDLLGKLLSEQEIKQLSHDDQLNLAASRLRSTISIKYPEADRIMYVSVRNPDPALAMTIANDHIATYVAYTKGLLSSSSNEASEALLAEFTDVEAKYRAAEDKIYKFQADHDMVALTLEEHQTLVTQNILAFTQKLNDAVANEITLSSKLSQMRKEAKEDVLSTPIVLLGDNPVSFETLRTEYYTEKAKLIELEKDLGPKNPDYISEKQQVDLLYNALAGEVNIILHGTEDQYAAAHDTSAGLSHEIDIFKDEAKRLSPMIVEYNELEREKKDIQDKYDILRARLSATQMTGSMSSVISNVHPLDPALLPMQPVSPNMRMNVLIAGLMGLLVGVGLVVLLVFLDRTVKSASDAMQASGVPVLGVIPMLTASDVPSNDERARDMYVHAFPKSPVAECCRSLRTNIMFSAAERPLRTILVCSANQREGKTTTAMYLGTSMAQSGQRVLLIDTDMRRPRLHQSTSVSNERGLSNLLIGDSDYDAVVQPTDVPNLFVLPCGPRPPQPSELLMTKRFETVLAELTARFDRVILDSPPIGPVTDAVILSKRADGVILVVRAGSTQRDELRRSVNAIHDVGGSIFGVIVNELDRRDSYGYGYGYGYSYTYGSGDDGPAEAA